MAVALVREEVSVRGIKTDVLLAGSGPKLLFLHSSWGPEAYTDVFLRALAQDFRVIAPYHPGYGRHERPKHFVTPSDIAYFYLDYLQQQTLSNILLVGAGIGGWIAKEIAVRSSQRLSKIVLIGPFGAKTGDRTERDYADFFAVSQAERDVLEFEKPEFRSLPYQSLSDDTLTLVARGREAEVHYGWNPFMHNPQLRHWLHRIEVPTLILRGSDDRMISAKNHATVAGLIPGAMLETVPRAGHHAHLEQPESTARRVRDFAAVAPTISSKSASV